MAASPRPEGPPCTEQPKGPPKPTARGSPRAWSSLRVLPSPQPEGPPRPTARGSPRARSSPRSPRPRVLRPARCQHSSSRPPHARQTNRSHSFSLFFGLRGLCLQGSIFTRIKTRVNGLAGWVFPQLQSHTIKLFQPVKHCEAVSRVTISKHKEKHSQARISLTAYSKRTAAFGGELRPAVGPCSGGSAAGTHSQLRFEAFAALSLPPSAFLAFFGETLQCIPYRKRGKQH